MKLIAVTGLNSYRDKIHALLRDREIDVFSEIDVKGYHQAESESQDTSLGWAPGRTPPTDSTLTWVFLDEGPADALLDAIAAFNEQRELDRPVRAFKMPVERAV